MADGISNFKWGFIIGMISSSMNPSSPASVVILFTRYPEPGFVKTRLIPALGAEEASRIHRRLTEKTLAHVRLLQRRLPVAVEIHFAGGNETAMSQWLGREWKYFPQGEGDLGRRMDQALIGAFHRRGKPVFLIGSDCPDLTANLLQKAIELLEENDLVLGPAQDGGYYLLGMKAPQPGLFPPEMPWGTDRVLAETLQEVERLGLQVALLETLRDIDRPEDLTALAPDPDPSRHPADPEISIIIPTLNEGPAIGRTLGAIGRSSTLEIIVADGGSTDGTCTQAHLFGARVVHAPQGRGRQMNRGAAQARGKLLLFLHADTLLPPGFADHIRSALACPGVAAGAFRLKIEPGLKGLSLIERLANFRSRMGQLPYGDQGLFLSANLFRETGGFPEIPMMEDIEFIRKLRRKGKIVLAPAAVITSARRWEKVGVWRNTLFNQLLLGSYFLGVNPETLARWYRSKMKR
jgi:uncharacterized protein